MPTFRKKNSSSDGSSSSSSSSSPSSGSSGSDSNSTSSDSDSSSSTEEKADKSCKIEETKKIPNKEEGEISQVLTRRKSAEFRAAAAAAAASSSASASLTITASSTSLTPTTTPTEILTASIEIPSQNVKSSDTTEKIGKAIEQIPIIIETSNKTRSISSLGNLRASRSSLTASEEENAASRSARSSSTLNATKRRNTATPIGSISHKMQTSADETTTIDTQRSKNEVDVKLKTNYEFDPKSRCTIEKPKENPQKIPEKNFKTISETDVEAKSELFNISEQETKPDPATTSLADTLKNTSGKTEPDLNFSKLEESEKPIQEKDSKAKVKAKKTTKKNNIANNSSTSTISSVADKEDPAPLTTVKKVERKKKKAAPTKARSKRPPAKRNQSGNRVNKISESESISAVSERISSTPSESEASESSNSYGSRRKKARRSKRGTISTSTTNNKVPPTDSDEVAIDRKLAAPRVFTRTINTRRCKRQLKQCNGVSDSDSDLLAELEAEKRALSKSPAKKPSITEIVQPKPREPSPPETGLKKCSVEGCDSTGHLGGILETHFLREACPIFHNMTMEECKTLAKERRHFEEEIRGEKTPSPVFTSDSMSSKSMTSKQIEFLDKIKDSRANFRVMEISINGEKVNGEKIADSVETEDAEAKCEPSLVGLVPDYDLQLFRDAQALASEKIEEEVKDLPVGKGIKYITMGKYKMKVWYQSPYPDDAALFPQMFICEFCLRNQKSEITIKRHALKCLWRHPPGDEIYRKGKLQVWQVDGRRYKVYCQQLCLLAKFFLDHKTLYYDVEPFLFYIMTLADSDGCHIVGYFSKEKNSFYNVSCILTLPPYQRKGYGRLLIDFSYLLTRVEGKIGSPEKPLSDLGLISYRSYWKDVLLDYLCNRNLSTLSIKDVSQEMAIYSYDIVSTLQALGMMKYWKGKHIVLKKQEVVDEYEERLKRRGNFPKIDKNCLRWTPFVPAQTNNIP